MVIVGKKKEYKEANVDKGQKQAMIFSSLRLGNLLFMALVLSALILDDTARKCHDRR